MDDHGYIDYFAVLDSTSEAKPGEIRKNYKKKMKDLVMEIARVAITEERRDRYLLELAKLNAAFYILRENERREQYVQDREHVMDLEKKWAEAVKAGQTGGVEDMRRYFDGALRDFLSKYMEELMLEAGRDKECIEASNWDAAHERHAGRVLRHFRHQCYQVIQERLPFYTVTEPKVDWDERARTVAGIIAGKGA
jgi:curved DNA-binding protein CbpA